MKLNVRAVFLDIDGTLVKAREDGQSDGFESWFVEWLTHRGVRNARGCWEEILAGKTTEEVIQKAGLPLELFLEGSVHWAAGYFEPTEGAAELLRSAAKAGRKLYLASTNAGIMALAKLRGAGLDVSALSGVCGGDEVLPGGKASPEFFRRLMRKTGWHPGEVLHIGDDLTADAEFSLAAGIGCCILLQAVDSLPPDSQMDIQRLKIFQGAREAAEWLEQLDEEALLV